MIRCNWKKHGLGVLLGIFFFVVCFGIINTTPVNADSCGDGQVETSFFGCVIDDGTGCGVWLVINVIIEVMTYGIGIAAAIGLVISGVMYLTAGDNIPKADKAKKRIFEIIVGLAIYVVLWSIASLLLPGGILNPSNTCKSVASNSGSNSASVMSTKNGSSSPSESSADDKDGELSGKTEQKKD